MICVELARGRLEGFEIRRWIGGGFDRLVGRFGRGGLAWTDISFFFWGYGRWLLWLIVGNG